MSNDPIEVQGTLRPDGTLVLDEKPNLPAGRVRVTVRQVNGPTPADDFWAGLHAIWAGQQARGHVPRSKEEIDAGVRALRDEAAEELRGVEQIHQAAEAERRTWRAGNQPGRTCNS
jgi:hypothetical protein